MAAWALVLAVLTAWLAVELSKRVRDLEEDVDLLAAGDTAALDAKRKLAARRVSREIGRDRL
jgi:hypothetical protein